MSEPKWRDRDTVTEELYKQGQWTWVSPGGYSNSCTPKKTHHAFFCGVSVQDNQVYGPIPDAPKPPPKLRRFVATHYEVGRVDGIYVPNRHDALDYEIFYWIKDKLDQEWCSEKELSDIQWIDP